MKNRHTLMVNSIILFALASISSFALLTAEQKPNVIMILTDDQGWGDLSLNGNKNLSTPNIDSLAHQGAMFDRFYVCPVCSPTRAEVLTGRYHQRSGVYSTSAGGERLNIKEKTLADAFLAAGYKTAAYGKWHNGMQGPYHPNARGFEEFYGFCSGHWGNYFSPMLEHNGKIVTGEGFLVDDLTNKAMTFMEENREKPFFVYLPYNTPHSPMQVPDLYWKKFKNHPLPQRSQKRENLDHTRAALAMCENIDWNVGRLLNKIDQLELKENTLVIYFSDNGPNGHRWIGDMKGKKGNTDEAGVRTPMLMRWPAGIRAGTQVTPICSAVDLVPTLMDICGLKTPGPLPLDGFNLLPLLKGKPNAQEGRIIVNAWNKNRSARNQRFRMTRPGKLYDMIKDPGQTIDVKSKHPEVAATMKFAMNEVYKDLVLLNKDTDKRPFYITYPKSQITQIPARDGSSKGNIKRSNRHPNSSYYTNWIHVDDAITWEAQSAWAGDYRAEIYYSC
ncbi:MAG: arylsulfatase, partial [Planctomycetes bacterium]|nr:arylsulfatase [Planctomycetota bacterium]